MKVSIGAVLYLILFIFSLFILVFIYFFRPVPSPPANEEEIQKFLDVIERRAGFSKPEPISAPRGACLDYLFPVEVSLEEKVVDALTPLNPELILECLDEDEASLSKVYSRCDKEDYCLDFLGRPVPSGSYLTFYEECFSGLKPCFEYNQSYLAAISIGGRCIERINDFPTLRSSICSLYNKEQLWRVNRVIPATLIGNSDGPLVRIYNRFNGRCLTTVLPAKEGSEVIQASCTYHSGYVWWLFPSLEFSEEYKGETRYFSSDPQLVWTDNATTFPENIYDFLARVTPLSLQLREEKFILAPYQKKSCPECTLQIIKYTEI